MSWRDSIMFDFLVGTAFVAMLIIPAVVASIQKEKSSDIED
jgi:hypothetical protein